MLCGWCPLEMASHTSPASKKKATPPSDNQEATRGPLGGQTPASPMGRSKLPPHLLWWEHPSQVLPCRWSLECLNPSQAMGSPKWAKVAEVTQKGAFLPTGFNPPSMTNDGSREHFRPCGGPKVGRTVPIWQCAQVERQGLGTQCWVGVLCRSSPTPPPRPPSTP